MKFGRGVKVVPISAVANEGLPLLLEEIWRMLSRKIAIFFTRAVNFTNLFDRGLQVIKKEIHVFKFILNEILKFFF